MTRYGERFLPSVWKHTEALVKRKTHSNYFFFFLPPVVIRSQIPATQSCWDSTKLHNAVVKSLHKSLPYCPWNTIITACRVHNVPPCDLIIFINFERLWLLRKSHISDAAFSVKINMQIIHLKATVVFPVCVCSVGRALSVLEGQRTTKIPPAGMKVW